MNLLWSTPRDNGCPLNMYTIYYREIQLTENDTPQCYETRITNIAQTFSSLSLKCGRQYEFTLTASNDAGESDKSHPLRINITGIKSTHYGLTLSYENYFILHNKFNQEGRESVVVREMAS